MKDLKNSPYDQFGLAGLRADCVNGMCGIVSCPWPEFRVNSFRNLGAFFRGKSFSKFGYVFSVSRFLQVSGDLEVS